MTKKNEPTNYTQDMQITIAKLEVMFDSLSKQLTKVEEKVESGLSGVGQKIIDLEAKIEMKYATKDDLTEIKTTQQDHENRTRSIEQNMWKWIGAMTVASAVLGVLISWIMKVL